MKSQKYQQLQKRGNRVRKRIGNGTPERPRMVVYTSNRAISAQIIDDTTGTTMVSANTLKEKKTVANIAAATKVGTEIAKAAKAKKITSVVFDRNGRAYHGK
jgi:large subunit ribosomal protein L18